MPKAIYTFDELRAFNKVALATLNNSTTLNKFVKIFGLDRDFDYAIELMVVKANSAGRPLLVENFMATRWLYEILGIVGDVESRESVDRLIAQHATPQEYLRQDYLAYLRLKTGVPAEVPEAILSICDAIEYRGDLDAWKTELRMAMGPREHMVQQWLDSSGAARGDGWVIDFVKETVTLDAYSDEFVAICEVLEKHGHLIGGVLDAAHHLALAFKAFKGLFKPLADAVRDDIKAVLKK